MPAIIYALYYNFVHDVTLRLEVVSIGVR